MSVLSHRMSRSRLLLRLMSAMCAYCGKSTEGNHTIHRDGFGEGPEVPLCDACGGGLRPTCEEIWARISENRDG